MKVQTILEFEELWDIVTSKETRPMTTGEDQNKFDQRSRKARMFILLGILDDVQPHV